MVFDLPTQAELDARREGATMKRSMPKDWTNDIIRRFKDGASVTELAIDFDTPAKDIEGIIRRAMQQQEEEF